jgi:hypothetical protein
MDITTGETNILFWKLEAMGWHREDDQITAPHGTMSLNYHHLWFFGTGRDMRDRMRGRLERILANREIACKSDAVSWQQSYDDTLSLVKCLDSVFGHAPGK